MGGEGIGEEENGEGDALLSIFRNLCFRPQLGATLYCMTVGRPPFMANSSTELAEKLLGAEEPAYPRDLSPSLRCARNPLPEIVSPPLPPHTNPPASRVVPAGTSSGACCRRAPSCASLSLTS